MTSNRTLKVTIVGDSKDAERAVRELEVSMGNLDRTAVRTGAAAGAGFAAVTLGAQALVGGAQRVLDVGMDMLANFRESERAGTRLDAVLKATGNTLGTTSDDILAYSTELQRATGVSDEAVTGVQTLLLTFKEIGPDVFGRTTEAALDMSAVFGQDLSSSAITLGKALQDPISGVTALRRTGIQLSETQEEQIQKFAELNDIAGAQNLILKEVESQVGGTARAMGEDGTGKADRLTQAIGDLKEVAGEAIAEGLDPLLDKTLEWAESDEAIQFARDFGDALSGVGTAAAGAAVFLKDLNTLRGAIPESIRYALGGQFVDAVKGVGATVGFLAGKVAPNSDGLLELDQEREAEDQSLRRWMARTADGRFLGGAPPRTTTFGLPSSRSGGGGGSGPTAFSAGNLGLIDSLLARAPGSPGAGDLAGFDAAALGFKNLQREITATLAELGLAMADYDARGLEQTDTFKEMEEQVKALRDAGGRLKDMEALRLDTIRDSIDLAREAAEAEKELGDARRRENADMVQRLGGLGMSAAMIVALQQAGPGVSVSSAGLAPGGAGYTATGPGASTFYGPVTQVFPGVSDAQSATPAGRTSVE